MRLPKIGPHSVNKDELRDSPLKDLPLELHLQILSLVDFRDIIAYRKTCKLFLFITSQRIIWVDLLKRVCSKNSVFKPTFPIEEMSLIDLEQAVFAPTRWLNQVMRSNADTIRTSRTITPLKNPYFYDVFLVPGGRFLVTFSETDVSVWDLGNSSSATLKNAPLASASYVPNYESAVVPTPDGLGLRICVCASCEATRNETCDEFWIFEIYPLSEKPALSKIASVVYEDYEEMCQFSLRGDVLILHAPHYVRVWNFVTNMSVIFDVGEEPFEKAWVTAESVILFRAGMIPIWNIPPLTPDGDMEETKKYSLEPSFLFGPSTALLPHNFSMPSEWYAGHPIIYDYVSRSDGFCVWRFEVILPEGQLKEQSEFVFPSPTQPPVFFEPYRFCNESLVMYWYDSNSVTAMATPISCERLEGTDSDLEYVIILRDQEEFEDPGFSLCPVAGRLCHISTERDSIIVLDYLNPSPP